MSLLKELYRNPYEIADAVQHIVEIIEDMRDANDWNGLEAASRIFAQAGYRDYKGGWIKGVPFTTNGDELTNTLRDISAQGDEMFPLRLKKKVLELTK